MPAFPLCVQCLGLNYCRQLTCRIVSDTELANPEFIRDVRAYAKAMDLSRDRWLSWLEDAYRDYPGVIVDANGNAVSLDFSAFDTVSIRYWFRDFIERETPAHIRPRLRIEAWERVRVFATLLRAANPRAAALWGIRATNDNAKNGPGAGTGPSCPYRDRVIWSPSAANDNHLDDGLF